jgi:hypothetical protein
MRAFNESLSIVSMVFKLLGALLKPQTRGGLFSPAEFLARVFLPVIALRFVALPVTLPLGRLGVNCRRHNSLLAAGPNAIS